MKTRSTTKYYIALMLAVSTLACSPPTNRIVTTNSVQEAGPQGRRCDYWVVENGDDYSQSFIYMTVNLHDMSSRDPSLEPKLIFEPKATKLLRPDGTDLSRPGMLIIRDEGQRIYSRKLRKSDMKLKDMKLIKFDDAIMLADEKTALEELR